MPFRLSLGSPLLLLALTIATYSNAFWSQSVRITVTCGMPGKITVPAKPGRTLRVKAVIVSGSNDRKAKIKGDQAARNVC